MAETDNLQGLDSGQLASDPIGTAQKFNALLRGVRASVATAAATILTTRGDLLTRSASALARLAVGAANTVLRSDGADPSWGKIVNADITDDTIAVGKLADGTAGQLITWDAAGEATTVATGNSGQALTSNGAGAAPTFQAQTAGDINGLTTTDNPASTAYVAGSIGSGVSNNRKFRVGEVGGWCALEEQTASTSASLSFVLTSYTADFEDFEFIIHALRPETDAVFLFLRTSTDGGSNYDAGASDYAWCGYRSDQGALTGDRDAADSEIELTTGLDSVGNTAGSEAFSGRVMLYNPAATVHTRITSHGNFTDAAGNLIDVAISGIRLAAADVDAVRFLMSSGNIASGKITLMGRRKVT